MSQPLRTPLGGVGEVRYVSHWPTSSRFTEMLCACEPPLSVRPNSVRLVSYFIDPYLRPPPGVILLAVSRRTFACIDLLGFFLDANTRLFSVLHIKLIL